MRKMKRLATLALTGAMVMGMSATAFAAPGDSATITVNNAEGATFTYAYAITPNERTATGWDIDDDLAASFTEAFGVTGEDAEQKAIAMLIKSKDANAALPSAYAQLPAATDAQIDTALNNAMTVTTEFKPMTNGQEVDKAGLYVINAMGEGYSYKVMSAYVGFGGTAEEYPALQNAELDAKKIETTITKADNDANDAVYIDQTVTYTLSTTFPYFKANETNRTFKITDTISGAHYVDLDNTEKAYVTIGGTKVAAEFKLDGNSFEVDLSSYAELADNNTYANQPVVVTYNAVVDETEVVNKSASHVGEYKYDSNEIKLYSGEITLLKYDAADPNKGIKLEGAKFEVKDEAGAVLKFVYDETNKVYTYDIENTEGAVTEIVTDENGLVKVEGLDLGTYTFVEVEAPEGYSINETPATATLEISGDVATEVFKAATDMSDTKLIALPGTGGVGTTMFTLGGCVIIAAAAGLLLANRRKEAR